MLRHELDKLATVGIHQHDRARIDPGRKSGSRHHSNESAVSARDNVHPRSRPGEIDRNLSAFPEWLDFFAHLRRRVSIIGKIDMVARRIIRTRPGDLRFGRGVAHSSRSTSASRQRTIRPDCSAPIGTTRLFGIALRNPHPDLGRNCPHHLRHHSRRFLRRKMNGQLVSPYHVILSEAKNEANGMNDMDRKTVRVTASESGDERVQSPIFSMAPREANESRGFQASPKATTWQTLRSTPQSVDTLMSFSSGRKSNGGTTNFSCLGRIYPSVIGLGRKIRYKSS